MIFYLYIFLFSIPVVSKSLSQNVIIWLCFNLIILVRGFSVRVSRKVSHCFVRVLKHWSLLSVGWKYVYSNKWRGGSLWLTKSKVHIVLISRDLEIRSHAYSSWRSFTQFYKGLRLTATWQIFVNNWFYLRVMSTHWSIV